MTVIRLLSGTDGRITGYEVSGHAGAGPHGQDIVCAAASFLATTCANALESVAGAKPRVTRRDGYLKAELKPGGANPEADVILKTFRQGAIDLADAYPDYVRLDFQAQK